MNKERLKKLINNFPGEKWDDKVVSFSTFAGRSRSCVYTWLTNGCPEMILDALEFRLHQR